MKLTQNAHLDDTDKAILNQIQSSFPLTPHPYAAVGDLLGLTEAEVVGRVQRMMQDGIIRRIGANFNSRRLGYTSTLCAAHVPPDQIEQFIQVVNHFPGVTHNYLRRHHLNIWFTLIAESTERISEILREIAQESGIRRNLQLPGQKNL